MPDAAGQEPRLADRFVSRETLKALDVLAAELQRWQPALNLVGPDTLPELWTRHIADSLQLVDHGGEGEWVDLGSGGGFPGLVIAATQRRPHVTLIESDSRKCAFLRHAVRAMGVNARVVESRIEAVQPAPAGGPRTVTARGLAPLRRLLSLAAPWLRADQDIGLFPKGRRYAAELTEAAESWRFDVELLPSQTDPDARIVRVTHLASR